MKRKHQEKHRENKERNGKKDKGIDQAISLLKNALRGEFSKRIFYGGENRDVERLYKYLNDTMGLLGSKMENLNVCNIELAEKVDDLKIEKKKIQREKILEDAIISSLGEGLVVIGEDKNIRLVNKQALNTFGVGRESPVGKPYHTLIKWQNKFGKDIPPHLDPIQEVFESVKNKGISLGDDMYCLRRKGERFPVMASVSPVVTEKQIRAVVAVFHDATKEKRIDEIKSDFISIASHQLRTPLTVANLHTEMLLAGHAGTINKEQKEYLWEIQQYNKKMATLLNDFLVVSKIEFGTFAVESKPANIRDVMDDVLHELETSIYKKQISIRKQYEPPITFAMTDPTLLRIVFQNIVSNAVKYTEPKGSVIVTVSPQKNHLLVSIKDNGYGIPIADQPHIFSKLYRGKDAKKRDSDGTGLGLYIAKSIVEKCGGTIWFESPPKNQSGSTKGGTEFFISLPKQRTADNKNKMFLQEK